MKFHMLTAAALLVGSTAVMAQDDAEPDPREANATVASSAQSATEDETEEEQDRGQEVVCRTERITGSLTRRRRTCMTRNEWAALEARTRDDMIRAGSRASGGAECRTGPMGGC